MGIYGKRFYFKQGLPDIEIIEQKFLEITGLEIEFKVTIWLNRLMTDRDEISSQLAKDRETVKYIFSSEFQGDKTKAQRALNVFSNPCFYCEGFDRIKLGDFVKEKSFHIEYGIGSESMYFFNAFIKTIFEIGGLSYDYHDYHQGKDPEPEEYLEPYYPHQKQWKNIKKWSDMSDYEKAEFKCKYA